MIRVLLVDDEQLVLDTLTCYFHTTRDLRVVATAPDGQAALEALRDLDIDVVLADIHMPVRGGRELLKRILAFDEPPVFVAMTAFDTDESMLGILADGGVHHQVGATRGLYRGCSRCRKWGNHGVSAGDDQTPWLPAGVG